MPGDSNANESAPPRASLRATDDELKDSEGNELAELSFALTVAEKKTQRVSWLILLSSMSGAPLTHHKRVVMEDGGLTKQWLLFW